MMNSFFITGTDTNVGKTVASRAIIQALQANGVQIVGYKPIACVQGEEDIAENTQDNILINQNHNDVITLMNSTNEDVSYQQINSYTFGHTIPLFTDQGEKIQISKLDQDLRGLTQQYQSVLIEGCFGWLSPINRDFSFADWISAHQIPVVLVVGIKEGCINHALLTVQSIQNLGLPLLGWVANRVNPCLGHYAEVIDILTEKIPSPLLGEIPYIYKPETQDIGKFITNIKQLTEVTK